MRYRDAKKLHSGDGVIRKVDGVVLTVESIEIYGQNMVVRINATGPDNNRVSLFHDEVE